MTDLARTDRDSIPPKRLTWMLTSIFWFAGLALPMLAGGAWWLAEASQAHALRHQATDHRVKALETAMLDIAAMKKSIQQIAIAVGADRARIDALHSGEPSQINYHGDGHVR